MNEIGKMGYLAHTEGKVVGQVGNIVQERATKQVCIDLGLATYVPIAIMDPELLSRLNMIAATNIAVRKSVIENLNMSSDTDSDARWLQEQWAQFQAPGLALVGYPVVEPSVYYRADKQTLENERATLLTVQRRLHTAPDVMNEQLYAMAKLLSRLCKATVTIEANGFKVESLQDQVKQYNYKRILRILMNQVRLKATGPIIEAIQTPEAAMAVSLVILEEFTAEKEVNLSRTGLAVIVEACRVVSTILTLNLVLSGEPNTSILLRIDELARDMKAIALIGAEIQKASPIIRMPLSRSVIFKSRTGDFAVMGNLEYCPRNYTKAEDGDLTTRLTLGTTEVTLVKPGGVGKGVSMQHLGLVMCYTGDISDVVLCIEEQKGLDPAEFKDSNYREGHAQAKSIIMDQLTAKSYLGRQDARQERESIVDRLRKALVYMNKSYEDELTLPLNASISETGSQLTLSGLTTWNNVQILEPIELCVHKTAIISLEDLVPISHTYPETTHATAGPWIIL